MLWYAHVRLLSFFSVSFSSALWCSICSCMDMYIHTLLLLYTCTCTYMYVVSNVPGILLLSLDILTSRQNELSTTYGSVRRKRIAPESAS